MTFYKSTIGSYRVGASLSSPHAPKLESSLYGDVIDLNSNGLEWEKHFNKYLFKHARTDLPKPCMYKGKPYWHGGIDPDKSEYDRIENTWISDMDCNLYFVRWSNVFLPTDKQYNQHFKKHIEDGRYTIVFNERNKTTKIKKVLSRKGKS